MKSIILTISGVLLACTTACNLTAPAQVQPSSTNITIPNNLEATTPVVASSEETVESTEESATELA